MSWSFASYEFECVEQYRAGMAECHGGMVWEIPAYEDVPVEPGKFFDGDDSDGSEGCGIDVEDASVGDVAAYLTVSGALESEDRGVARFQAPF